MNEVLKAIRERRSIRSYEERPVEKEKLDQILEAGLWAPSAMNRQPVRLVCVTRKDDCDRLRRLNAAVMGRDGDPYYGAPCIIVALCLRSAATGREDASLALENMMLAAHAVGLASCWINREHQMFDTEEGKSLMRQWGLPDGLMGIGALSLGYAAAEPREPKPRKEDYYRIIR